MKTWTGWQFFQKNNLAQLTPEEIKSNHAIFQVKNGEMVKKLPSKGNLEA